jgi:hypothetical protein
MHDSSRGEALASCADLRSALGREEALAMRGIAYREGRDPTPVLSGSEGQDLGKCVA